MQIRLAPNTANEVVLGTDNISNMDFVKTHTGLSDYDITVQRGLGVHDRVLDELWLEQDDGTLLFRGLLESVDEQEGANVSPTATLSGHGVGYKLERSSAFIEVLKPTFAQEVIEDFWTNETAFSPTVIDPTPANTITDETAQEASTTAEFENIFSIADSDPLEIGTDQLNLLQSSFTVEAENATDEAIGVTDISDSEYSDGTGIQLGDDGDFVEYEITIDYTVPAGEFDIYWRGDVEDPNVPQARWLLLDSGGSTVEESDTTSLGLTGLEWRSVQNDWGGFDPPELSPGTYTIRFEENDASPPAPDYLFDVVAPLDSLTRFTGGSDATSAYTFDNDNGGSSGYLDGPELFPPSLTEAATGVDTPWNITDGILTTTWDNTSNNQAIQLRLSSQTWFPNDGSENNTSSITTDFGDEVGQTIQGRAIFSRYGSRTTATPQTGFNGQSLSTWEITYDGNDNPIIAAGETFQGSQLEVAQRLHERADMRFTLLHSKDSLPVESYRPGDNVKTLPEVHERSRTNRTDLSGFFNSVEVFGQRDENGDRLSATEKDQASINELGEQYWSVFDPSLDTEEALQSKARAVLNEKLREREDKGEIEIAPENIPAGFSYDNPFNDGSTTIPIEETSYQITLGDISGRLVFDFQTGQRLAEDIGGLRKGTQNAKLGF